MESKGVSIYSYFFPTSAYKSVSSKNRGLRKVGNSNTLRLKWNLKGRRHEHLHHFDIWETFGKNIKMWSTRRNKGSRNKVHTQRSSNRRQLLILSTEIVELHTRRKWLNQQKESNKKGTCKITIPACKEDMTSWMMHQMRLATREVDNPKAKK